MDTLNESSVDDFIDFERELAVFGQPSGDVSPEIKSALADLDDIAGDESDSAPLTKSVKARWRSSVFRDAKFMRDFSALSSGLSSGASGESSVIRGPSASPSIPSTSSPRSSMRPWWKTHASPAARAYRTPPLWREASDYLKAEYYHRALKAFGFPYEFTVNLSPDIEAQARRQADPLDWLSRRVARRLKAVYGRSLPFWGVIEETPDRRLHLHGEIAVDGNATARDLVRLRKSLRLAAGEWEMGRQHQVRIRPAPDEGWVSYCLKDFWRGLPGVRARLELARSPWRLTFGGSMLAGNGELNKKACALYADERRLILGR